MRKVWAIIAAILVVAGLIALAVVMHENQWNVTKLSTQSFTTNTYEVRQQFHSISMDTDTADIQFVLSKDGKCKVECYEDKTAKHSVTVEEDTLVIRVANDKNWHVYVGIHFDSPKITVYLPQTQYASLFITEDTGRIEVPEDFAFDSVDIQSNTGDVAVLASARETMRIHTSTGYIRVGNVSAGALDLSVSTGDVTVSQAICKGDLEVHVSTGKAEITDTQCQNLISTGNTGDISLKNVIAAGSFSITRSTGDVKFEKSDATELFIKTDTGDVRGSLLTEKVFIAQTDTGDVDVPKTTTGGRCEIQTDTGDIDIEIP